MKIPRLIKKQIKALGIVKKYFNTYNPSIDYLLDNILDTKSNKIVLDVGANEGQTIDWALGYFDKPLIYSFEPTPDLFKLLKSKYSNYQNVRLYNIALGDFNGKATFFTSNYSPTNSLLKYNKNLYDKFNKELSKTLSGSDEIEVDVETLEKWANNNLCNKTVDLLKSDTQGNEYNVIKGGTDFIRNKVKIVIFEVQYLDFYKGSIPFYKTYELLYQNGFYLFNNFGGSRVSNVQLIENNAVFLNKKYFDVVAKK